MFITLLLTRAFKDFDYHVSRSSSGDPRLLWFRWVSRLLVDGIVKLSAAQILSSAHILYMYKNVARGWLQIQSRCSQFNKAHYGIINERSWDRCTYQLLVFAQDLSSFTSHIVFQICTWTISSSIYIHAERGLTDDQIQQFIFGRWLRGHEEMIKHTIYFICAKRKVIKPATINLN